MSLFNKMRGEAEKRGFLNEEEIEAEIQAARSEMRIRGEFENLCKKGIVKIYGV
jgi:hypothetical protein